MYELLDGFKKIRNKLIKQSLKCVFYWVLEVERLAYIYKIENTINKKFYIGSSVNYKRRWEQHIYELNKNKHDNIHLQRAWNKYGKDNFEFSIIEECENSNQYIEEQYYLDMLQPFGDIGYNMSRIAKVS